MKGNKLVTGIICILIAVLVCVLSWSEIIGMFKSPIDLDNELDSDIPVGSRVTVGVDAVVDWYATMEHKTNGITTSEDYYCMIWLDDTTFMGLKVKKSDRDKIDDIIDATWAYMDSEADELPSKVYFTGTLRKMESKEKTYFQDLLSDIGFESNEWPEKARYYTIDTTTSKAAVIIGIVVFAVLLIFGIINIILFAKDKKARKLQAQAGPYQSVSQTGFDAASFDSAYPNNTYNAPYNGSSYGAGSVNDTNGYQNDTYNPPYNGGTYGDSSGDNQNGNGYNQ